MKLQWFLRRCERWVMVLWLKGGGGSNKEYNEIGDWLSVQPQWNCGDFYDVVSAGQWRFGLKGLTTVTYDCDRMVILNIDGDEGNGIFSMFYTGISG